MPALENASSLALVTYCCPFQCVARRGSWELCSCWDLLIGAAPRAPLWRVLVAVELSLTDRCWQRLFACLALRESSHTCLGGGEERESVRERDRKRETKANLLNCGTVFQIWRFDITCIVELLTRLRSDNFGVWIFSLHFSHCLNKWIAVYVQFYPYSTTWKEKLL